MSDLGDAVSKEENLRNFDLTKQNIEGNKPISQEAGNAFFTTNLKLLSEKHDSSEMDEICRLLKNAIENGYDPSIIKEQKYRKILKDYGMYI